ncbi:hypothetical protein Sjap_023934 [Stephania japonica]|uniref:BAHD acyltransferase n=1 Tax=Stephania japonica TaxID=461633 RepID=A0AAP0EFQ7_9MAGN
MASVLPPIDVTPSLGEFTEVSTAVLKVFRFEASKIAELKDKAKANADEKDPSRMAAITAFLWGVPGLHEHTMGNAVVATPLTVPMAPPVDLTAMPELVKEMRELVKRVDMGGLVKRVDKGGLVKRRDGGEVLKMMETYLECYNKASSSEGELGLYDVSSMLRFPFYEADFGWGKPA